MSSTGHSPPGSSPPSFAEARNPRQKVRAAGLHPDYWYPVEHARAIKRGQVVEVTFWNRSIALFRGMDGRFRALEDRCAHRQLKLSLGEVDGCNLNCTYHGWSYNGEGRVEKIPHELFGREMPSLRVRRYPVQVRYGLVWIFPGDPAKAAERAIPEIPELQGPGRWACVPIDFTWQAHHSMIIENINDFTHAYLHRKYQPFDNAKLIRLESADDRVSLTYQTRMGAGRIFNLFVDRRRVRSNKIDLCYDYPYQWSNTDDQIKHWCFILPIDARRTRAFFLFYYDSLRVPFTSFSIPRRLMTSVIRGANRLLVKPLLAQDGFAVEAEQAGYDTHHQAPIAELNPAVPLFQQLTIRKWEEHLVSQAERRAVLRPSWELPVG